MNAKELAILKANSAALTSVQRRVNQQIDRDGQVQTIGAYVGYNADLGTHQVQVPGGGMVEVRSLSNAGQQTGDTVAIAYSGMTAYMRALSR